MTRPRVLPVATLILFILASIFPLCAAGRSESYEPWWDGFARVGSPGADTTVYCMTVYEGDLILGGYFTSAGGTAVNHVVRWDGASWSPLGGGVTGMLQSIWVRALTVFEGELIAGGRFESADGSPAMGIARWDGTSWQPLGDGVHGSVYTLAVWNGDLYVGGDFEVQGIFDLVRWNRISWSAVGTGVNDAVEAIAVFDDQLYVGGRFTVAGGSAAARIARWDGASWHPLADGITGSSPYVEALAVHDGALFVGGQFQHAGGEWGPNIALWNGSAWSGLQGGTNAPVSALASHGGLLYAGGWFTYAGEVPARSIAAWDGSSWSAVGGGVGRGVETLQSHDGSLFAGGWFREADGLGARHIARWDGAAWESVGPPTAGAGLDGPATSMAVHEGRLVVAGWFLRAGGIEGDLVAAWDGTLWTALGAGIPHPHMIDIVTTLAVHKGILYAGTQEYDPYPPYPTGTIWRWSGTTWLSIGRAEGGISDLISHQGDLIAAGSFWEIDGMVATGIARWDGMAWHPLGEGTGVTLALAEYDGLLVSGGYELLFWDGLSWQTLAGEVHDVDALHVRGGDLFAGGRFTEVGGVPAQHVARWDGAAWSPLDDGVEGIIAYVHTFADYGGQLVVGGYFPIAGGRAASNVALWNGAAWKSMGSGTSDAVRAAIVYENALYVAGDFRSAGAHASFYIARWDVAPSGVEDVPQAEPLRMEMSNPYRPGAGILLYMDSTGIYSLVIYDISGRRVRDLLPSPEGSGRLATSWDGRTGRGDPAAPGVYFVRAVDRRHQTLQRTIVLVRPCR